MNQDAQETEELVNYVPSACRGEGAAYQGSVTFKALSFEERWALVEKYADLIPMLSNIRGEDGKVNMSAMLNPSVIKSVGGAVKDAAQYYRSVDIKRVKDGRQFKSFEDLGRSPGAYFMILEIAIGIIKGTDEGN